MIVVKIDTNLQTCSSIEAKIAKIDGIIDALFNQVLTAVQNGNTVSYTFNDGRTNVSKTVSSVSQITPQIKDFENLRAMYESKLLQVKMGGSRVVRLVDSKSIRNGRLY